MMSKKIRVFLVISFFLTGGIAATTARKIPGAIKQQDAVMKNQDTLITRPVEKPHWKNVKVIPKNTDDDQMERIMFKMAKSLGVTCLYCHVPTRPEIFPKRVDFGSDESPAKRIARDMMRMTDKINRKYFNYTNSYDYASITDKFGIDCNSCHYGLQKPSNVQLFNR